MTLPRLSIAAKLYAIFALLATVTVALAIAAVVSARHHAALTDAFEAAFRRAQDVERVNGLVYAVVMEERGLLLAPDHETAKQHAATLNGFNGRISEVMKTWQGNLRDDDGDRFHEFAGRVRIFQDFRSELARRAAEIGVPEARSWADFDDSGSVQRLLSKDLAALSAVYAQRAERIYQQIDLGIAATAKWMSALGIAAMLLAGAGAIRIWRDVVRPITNITRVTQRVAEGGADIAIPHESRRDEVGALARSIAVFQQAMRRNEQLNSKVLEEAQDRARRQEQVSAEIARFSGDVEASIAQLGTICDQMLAASRQLADAADDASHRSSGATAASNEASNNVRDIASAADELAASVMEIDRQVAQSNTVAEKAVGEAERTNRAVKELDEAAKRIGDVIRLITDIAEQTNLLALNATIEAARAGEAGRGFAVVAGEVKALAGQTARATDEIGAQIAGMQQATLRSINAIGAIERTIREIGDISGAIAAAVTEQGAATQEIARSVEIAAKRTVDTADEIGRVGLATDNTRVSVDTVKQVADELGTVAGRIRGEVDAFFERLRAA